MRFIPRSLLLVLPLAALLTWLLLHSVGPRGQDYVWAQRDVARVSLGEAALRGDTLQARIGLLANYDPLVDDMRMLSTFVDELGRQAMIRREDATLMVELKAQVRQDETALEQFKSDNALLQNSLTYFDVLNSRLAAAGLGEAMTSAVDKLGSAVLELGRHPTPGLIAATDADLEQVAALAAVDGKPTSSRDLALLLTHGRLLAQLLPAVDRDLRILFAISTDALRDRIRQSQDSRRIREEHLAEQYRLALYGASVLLLAVLTVGALERRAGLQLLGQQARIEALLADISAMFLAAPASDYRVTMQHALAQLGTMFEADRVHLLDFAGPEETIRWCAPGVDEPTVPVQSLLDAVSSAAIDADELLDIPLVSRAKPGPLADALGRAGIVGWFGMVLRVGDQRRALLSFDRLQEASTWPRGGTRLLRVAADIVQGVLYRRQALIQRGELEARLGRGRRLEAVGTFASGIAHNFNNMIGAIMGHAEMAADAAADPARAAYHIEEIRRAGERTQQLVGRILEFGARRTTPMRTVPVDRLLDDTLSMLRVTLPPHVALVAGLQATKEVVQGDALQLQQVLMNLVSNAAQAMARPGTITIQADTVRLTKMQLLSHETITPGNYLRIRVADTGSGMDAATLANVFQPFFTTRPAGTGLGLATVREIIHDHAGGVDVHTREHEGSMFTIWLPSGQPDAEPIPDRRNGIGKTILLMAPSRALVLNDEEMLAALGYEPVGFHDMEAALDAARANPDRFDAVLVDPAQLGATGCALIRQIRALLPAIPLVLVTAGPITETPAELADLGVSLQTRRPIRTSALAASLADCMDTQSL
ncbi:MAG: two-component system VirA-like sensor kinase [Janthinobacterium lividum]